MQQFGFECECEGAFRLVFRFSFNYDATLFAAASVVAKNVHTF